MVLSFPFIEWETGLDWTVADLKKAVKEKTELAGPIDMLEMDPRSRKQFLEDLKSQGLGLGEPLEGFID